MSGDEPILAGMAGRYAQALFDLASDEGAIDGVERDLVRLAALVRGSADLARVVKSPVYTREEQGNALAAVLKRLGAGSLTGRFIGLLAKKRRLFALLDIVAAYRTLASRKRGEIAARVVSAHPLSERQRTELSDVLRQSFRREVKLETEVDARLLGGLVVKVGSRMIDSSLATKLDRLKVAMKEA